jgi:glutamate-ammonia-ligase adenylyltransferase
MAEPSLFDRIRRAPRVLDAAAAANAWEALRATSADAVDRLQGRPETSALLEAAFSSAPYLARAARRRTDALAEMFARPPEESLARLVEAARSAGAEAADEAELKAALRIAKLDLHLLAAFADLGGAWDLDQVTGALTKFADASVAAALEALLRVEAARGGPSAAPAECGLVVLALGKQGAFELNYSSDIDLIVLFDKDRLAAGQGRDAQELGAKLAKGLVRILQEPTADGYVFRVDLRLRPDPGATPPAINLAAALRYYESLGQTWERAALIKARPCAGDLALGDSFLKDVAPFIWRRSLDFSAIEDLRAMKRQIQAHADAEGRVAPGAEIKRGYGGIREIEFFAQGHQLIHGGRDPRLRARGTVATLRNLVAVGHVEAEVAETLVADYVALRDLEHRLQMVEDHQTHRVPVEDAARAPVAALLGAETLAAFDRDLEARLARVRGLVDELFKEEAAEPQQSWVISSVEDTGDARARLGERGFKEPGRVTDAVRGWRAGRVPATRSPRAQGLLERVLPLILDAIAATDAPDAAFVRFAEFFERLPAGVQTLSLFASEPNVLRAVLDVLNLAPRLGAALARRPELMDVMLEPDFARPVAETTAKDAERIAADIAAQPDFEHALNAARREVREARFRIGVQALMGVVDARDAGEAHAVIADLVIRAMTDAARGEIARRHGTIDAEYVVLALGKLGGRELSAASDLDLMTVYAPSKEGVRSRSSRPVDVDAYFTRVTQRLITALSAHTEEGGLYEVDMQLRPSGKAGPIAVQLPAFKSYYEKDAWTWELMALTRARVIAADPRLGKALEDTIRTILTRERAPDAVFAAVVDMRARMAAERAPRGEWDLKLSEGGFVDIEFAAQALQLVHAHAHPDVLAVSTLEAIRRLARAGALEAAEAAALSEALTLQLDLTQALSVAVDGVLEPETAPNRLKERLFKIGGVDSFEALEDRLRRVRAAARGVFERRVLSAAP